jgi:hypothetical protein
MAGSTYKSASNHVEDLSDGRTLAPGEVVSLTKEELSDPHNKRLIDEGVLITAEQPKDKEGGNN